MLKLLRAPHHPPPCASPLICAQGNVDRRECGMPEDPRPPASRWAAGQTQGTKVQLLQRGCIQRFGFLAPKKPQKVKSPIHFLQTSLLLVYSFSRFYFYGGDFFFTKTPCQPPPSPGKTTPSQPSSPAHGAVTTEAPLPHTRPSPRARLCGGVLLRAGPRVC